MSGALTPGERLRLEELFDRAADLPPAEQAAFVEREGGPSGALREELERMLAGLAAEDVLGRLRPGGPLPTGTRVGPYRLLERIGEGGMGEVYAADQLEPVQRRVALKIIKLGMDSAQVAARFEAERQALARMSHANVAQVFDGGTTADGRPYFVMEHVPGDPITDYCDRRKLPTRARLALFLAVCEGVQHAHQKGLIHRDLKPSNLLVMEQDGRPLLKIIDFGVARATSGSLAERTLHTMVGQVVGTLDYMSPEQADPTALDIDTRSDIYSLGVVLYQLASGLLPFEHSSAGGRPLSEVQRAIREQDPPTPSTHLKRRADTVTAIAPLHGTDGRSLVRQLAGDLDWITLKALEKDPARRYPSASELAEDLRRHLAHEPVRAGRPDVLYRARKFVRRNRAAVIAGVLTAAGAVAGISGIVSGHRVARALRPVSDEYGARVLLREAQDLWPPHPEGIPDMEAWLVRARELIGSLPGHRARLERAHQDSSRDLLATLVGELEELDPDAGLLAADAVLPGRGWSVPKRLAFARDLQAGFAEGGEHHRAWAQALPEIHAARADLDGDGEPEALYADLDLEPQMGLAPLGPDPDTRLWEFAHLATGAPPRRDAEERLVLTEETGVVLVLIPGRSFEMGSNEPGLKADTRPVHRVRLSAHFVSKYEMTQGQWERLTGANPSRYRPGRLWEPDWLESGAPVSLLHPVEQVSWEDCTTWLPRVGLSLPSEAQWEHAARGGTSTAYWTGDPSASLAGADNVSDGWAQEHGGAAHAKAVAFSDGSTMHWAVGGHRANRFGLEDVHGNVYEWCLDGYDDDVSFYDLSPELDPVAPAVGEAPRVHRGGSYRAGAGVARSAARSYYPPGFKGHALGVRPARALDPLDP